MRFELYEDKNAIKFIEKHKKDSNLITRINKEYKLICENPFNSKYKQLKSLKCPKCQRAKVGKYRIIFYVSKEHNAIQIVDIITRRDNYMRY